MSVSENSGCICAHVAIAQFDLLENAMGVQSQVCTVGIPVNVIIADSDKLGIDGKVITRITLDSAAGHGLVFYIW